MQVGWAEIEILSLYLAWLLVLTLQQAGVVNAVAGGRPPCRKLWHIAGSKWQCWLPEKTTKCLWQEASTLRQRQQNSAFNCTQWQICSLCNLTIKDSTRHFVLLKITTVTDTKHRAASLQQQSYLLPNITSISHYHITTKKIVIFKHGKL